MRNKTTNKGKPAQQSSEQSSVDKTSVSTAQDNAALIRRRSLLKGLGAAPLVMTLHNGAAMAASSTGGCVGDRGLAPKDCVAGTSGDHDSFLRVEVDVVTEADGTVVGIVDGWDDPHPLFSSDEPEKKLCLVSVDEFGNIDKNTVNPLRVTTNSCWCSFT